MVRGEGPRHEDQASGATRVCAFDLEALSPTQRSLWDEYFADSKKGTDGTICQLTLMKLWSFDQICMLEADSCLIYPPELERQLRDFEHKLAIYMRNMRAARVNKRSTGPAS